MQRKALSFYAIQYGGVPMTPQGRERFIRMAKAGGYTDVEVHEYLKPYFGTPVPTGTIDRIKKVVQEEKWPMVEGEYQQPECSRWREKIIAEIDKEMQELNSGCPQETCPMSNLQKGKYDALKKIKEFIEGL